MAEDTWALITKRQTALQKLHDRMDKTKDLAYLTPFALTDWDGKPIRNVINVTGNRPALFAEAIISDLMSANWQMSVEGDISQRQAHLIEQFIKDNLEEADEMLLNKFGISSLDAWNANHVCIRSLIGVRWLSLVENGEYKIDCLPVDMRWTPWQRGNQVMRWVAPITFRSKDDLLEEFPNANISGETDIEVRDFWNAQVNEVWVAQRKIFEQKNPLGKPPFVIVLPSSGFMLRDKGYLEHEAEDLFFLNRGLYDEENRSLSIEQSIAFEALYPAYEYETMHFDATPSRPTPRAGETKKVPTGERHFPLEKRKLNEASMVARQDIQGMIERGGPTLPRQYTQPPSAVELYGEIELLAKLQKPRLEALQAMRQGLARLMIDQFIQSSAKAGDLLVGKTGKKNRYSAANLGDPDKYLIRCELITSNRRQEIANWALAGAARGTAPLKVIIRDILKAEDPDGWMKELVIEEARKADPAIALHEMALRYVEEAEEVEDEDEADAKLIQAKMLMERGVALIRARQQPTPTEQLPEKAKVPQVEQPKGNAQTLIPLLGQKGLAGGGGGKQARQTEEEVTE